MKRILAALFMLASLLIANVASAVTTHEVLTVILTLPQYGGDIHADTPDQRAKLLRPVAEAISAVAKNKTEAAALVALGFHETAFARYVVDGLCEQGPVGARCDGGRARGPWQLWSWCRGAWDGPDGTRRALNEGARCAVGLLRSSNTLCKKGLHGAFSGYAGRGCDWYPAKARVSTTGLLEGRLKKLRGSGTSAPVVVEGTTRVSVQ